MPVKQLHTNTLKYIKDKLPYEYGETEQSFLSSNVKVNCFYN